MSILREAIGLLGSESQPLKALTINLSAGLMLFGLYWSLVVYGALAVCSGFVVGSQRWLVAVGSWPLVGTT